VQKLHKNYYLDLFSGIGGFALGAKWAGLEFDGHYFEVDSIIFDY
jgi:site-specific DNA-cytosine methylase